MPKWTWKRIAEALHAKGYVCSAQTMHGRKLYQIVNPDPYGGFRSRFDTVEEVRDSFGFGDPTEKEVD
jgi:hypothetical protein